MPEVLEEEKSIEAIEINDDDKGEEADVSDTESVVEVVEPVVETIEPVEVIIFFKEYSSQS